MPDEYAHISRRREIASRLGQLLKASSLEVARCGGARDDLQYEIDANTGLWLGNSPRTKPPRLLIHLKQSDGIVQASLAAPGAGDVFAYANTQGGRRVALLLVRVLPVVQVAPREYLAHPAWEWALWFCFYPTLEAGNSGEAFKGLNPADGTFQYRGRLQPYIASGLVTLCQADDPLTYPDGVAGFPLTYGEATAALAALLHTTPSSAGNGVGTPPDLPTPVHELTTPHAVQPAEH